MPASPQVPPVQPAPGARGFSVLRIIVFPILIILVLFGLLEIFSRTQASRGLFPLRSYGNYHTQFEIKWQKLDRYVKENGGVDVIFLGSSMVNTGIDPEILTKQLKAADGRNLRIFNFGVEGLTVVPMADLASLLVDTYHPKTIIYYTELRDYLAGNGDEVANSFLSNQWLQYRLGQRSAIGWAVDHSAALQALLPLRTWANADFLVTYLLDLHRLVNTHPNGYEPEIQVSEFTGKLPNPANPKDQKLFTAYQNYAIDPSRLEYLRSILSLQEKGTTIWITEFPTYPGFYTYFGGEQVHTAYLQAIDKYITDNGGVFIPSIDPGLIPFNGRSDDHHLNSTGAKLYSNLLAGQLTALCREQHLCLGRK